MMVSRQVRIVHWIVFALALLVSAVSADMYSEEVEVLTPSNFDEKVINTAETWMIKFYAPWCGHCKSSAPAFSKAAKKLSGVARLGVVNCDDHQELAQRFSIQGFPTIKVFKGDTRKARRPSSYDSARTTKAIVDHVKYIMPSYVARVKPTGSDAFFQDLPSLPHVLLFTDKSTTSPLYKGMSARFKGRLSFGEVRKSEVGDLGTKYKVNKYPTLLAFDASSSSGESAVPFNGSMDPASLDAFFSGLTGGNASGGGDEAMADGGEEKKSEKVFTQPKAAEAAVVNVVGTRAYEESCGSRKDGRMCALAIVAGGTGHALNDELIPVAKKYMYDNLAFAIMDGSVDGGRDFAQLFGLGSEGGFIVIRARKKKYAILESEEVSVSGISSFLDKIVGGDARWKKIADALPNWVVEGSQVGEDGMDKAEGDGTDESGGSASSGDEAAGGQCNAPPSGDDQASAGGKCGSS